MRTNRTAVGLAFTSPWLLGFLLLIVWPFAASLYWSFCRYDLLTSPVWVGSANYERLGEELAQGQRFGQAVWNTAYYALVSVPLSIALGVGLATMLSWEFPGRSIARTIIYLPSVVPTVAVAVLWFWLLDPQQGFVNWLLSWVGIPPQGWFNSYHELFSPGAWMRGEFSAGAKDGLVLMTLWGVGHWLIIYLAAIGDIPKSLYEAAELDGAGHWARFRHITLPMLSPVIFFNLVMGLIQAVQVFTQFYVVSHGEGGPAGSTLVISLYLVLSAFKNLEMGYASAMAWMLFVLVLAATVLLFRTAGRWVFYQGGAR